MEGWVKIGVQRAYVLYPNSCYNEPCYIEVQVYIFFLNYRISPAIRPGFPLSRMTTNN